MWCSVVRQSVAMFRATIRQFGRCVLVHRLHYVHSHSSVASAMSQTSPKGESSNYRINLEACPELCTFTAYSVHIPTIFIIPPKTIAHRHFRSWQAKERSSANAVAVAEAEAALPINVPTRHRASKMASALCIKNRHCCRLLVPRSSGRVCGSATCRAKVGAFQWWLPYVVTTDALFVFRLRRAGARYAASSAHAVRGRTVAGIGRPHVVPDRSLTTFPPIRHVPPHISPECYASEAQRRLTTVPNRTRMKNRKEWTCMMTKLSPWITMILRVGGRTSVVQMMTTMSTQ